jgi:three-Cys-motif partner protein
MPRSHYDGWSEGKPAKIKQHSIAKHDVLRAYLVEYMDTLVRPGQDAINLTLVDGFAGGGLYEHEDTKELILGSPFVFLDAIRESQIRLSIGRKKDLAWNIGFFFVEKDRAALQFLRGTLLNTGYGDQLDKDVHLLQGTFERHADFLIGEVKKRTPRNGRSIFLLDQYGYKDVPTSLMRKILTHLPRAEIILTFAVDSFINFASDSENTKKVLHGLDIPDPLQGRTFEEIKRNEKDFRLFIQSQLYKSLVDGCGAKYYTVFFIRTDGHGDYWLVHLSQHPRARDVMTRVHWEKNNNFIHYGGGGIQMFRALGYSPNNDTDYTNQSPLGFCFDESAANVSRRMLADQLAPLIREQVDGVTYGNLFSSTCNESPADGGIYKRTLEDLLLHKEIEIVSPEGARRFKASTIRDDDILRPAMQRTIFCDRM